MCFLGLRFGYWHGLFNWFYSRAYAMIKKPVGRPLGTGKSLFKIFSARLTAKQFEAVQKLGGREWLRKTIEKELKK